MTSLPADHLWRIALAVVPLAMLVAVTCRLLPCRASTRHALWLTVLAALIVGPFLPAPPVEAWSTAFAERAPAWRDAMSSLGSETSARHESPSTTPAATKPMNIEPAATKPIDQTGSKRAPVKASPPPVARRLPLATVSSTPADVEPGPRLTPPPIFERRRPALPTGRSSGGAALPVKTTTPTPNVATVVPAIAPATAPVIASPIEPAVESAKGSTVETTPPPSAASSVAGPSGWQQWLADARATIMSIPPLPLWLWTGGVIVAVTVALFRMLCLWRIVLRTTPADATTRRLVADAAKAMGIPRVPRTRMMNGTLSPMVLCGPRPTVLLPRQLWRQLDSAGRRAVVYHEVAHLRRRDHWVCWFSLIVGCVYWWHPVVWWARRQLREEADLCCDAWVTTLMPSARRAYAVALLETKRFACRDAAPVPAVGLGVSTLRARRFARRLTMVMTHHVTPKMTIGGTLLAVVTITAGALVTPSLACPPSADKTDAKVKAAIAVRAPRVPTAPRPAAGPFAGARPMAPTAPRPATPPIAAFAPTAPSVDVAPEPDGNTFEHFMNRRYQDRGGMALEERIGQLEEHLNQLIEQLMENLPQMQEHLHKNMKDMARQLEEKARKHMHAAEDAEHAFGVAHGEGHGGGGVGADTGSNCSCIGGDKACKHETDIRAYKVSKGKLKALTDLMVRADVPVLVSPGETQIEVHGTPPQHRVFGAFVRMIDPKAASATSPTSRSGAAVPSGRGQNAHVDSLRQMLRTVNQQVRSHEQASRQLERQVGRIESKIAKLEDKIATCEDGLEEAASDQQRAKLTAQMRLSLDEIRALEGQLVALEAQAREHEMNAEQLEDRSDALEDELEAIDEADEWDDR